MTSLLTEDFPHGSMAALQGGAVNEYFHLTNAEYTGTGTGNFVRLNAPALTGAVTGGSFNAITGLSTATPLMDGTATVGTSTLVAREGHIHPTDTSRQAAYTNLTTIGSLANSSGFLYNNGSGAFSYSASTIAPGSITSTELGDSAVISSKISANAVLANNLMVANFDNLIPNPNSEQAAPPGGWPAGAYEAAWLINAGIDAFNGSWTRASNAVGETTLTPWIPCAPGDSFYFEAWAKDQGSTTKRITIAWDITGSGSEGMWDFTDLVGNTSYMKMSKQASAPAGAVAVRFKLEYAAGTGWSWFDALYARRMADANLIVDGAITSSKLAPDISISGVLSATTGTFWGSLTTYGTISQTFTSSFVGTDLLPNAYTTTLYNGSVSGAFYATQYVAFLTGSTTLTGSLYVNYARPYMQASGAVASIAAYVSDPYFYNGASGSVTELCGFLASSGFYGGTASSPITSIKQVSIRAPFTTNVTNAYGLYVATISGATNNWSIYVVGGRSYFGGTIQHEVYTVATLPTGLAGMRSFVSDANSTTFASIVAGGGTNGVPVYSDGTNWRIG